MQHAAIATMIPCPMPNTQQSSYSAPHSAPSAAPLASTPPPKTWHPSDPPNVSAAHVAPKTVIGGAEDECMPRVLRRTLVFAIPWYQLPHPWALGGAALPEGATFGAVHPRVWDVILVYIPRFVRSVRVSVFFDSFFCCLVCRAAVCGLFLVSIGFSWRYGYNQSGFEH